MIGIERIDPKTWARLSEGMHKRVFKEIKPAAWDRIDYALLAVKENEPTPCAYMTCRELDAETVYWQFGGMLESIRGTTTSWKAYLAFLAWHKAHYRRATSYIENTNIAYLKMALKAGFVVIGTRTYKNRIFLDVELEFNEEKAHA